MINLKDPVVEEILYQGMSDYVALTTVRALVVEESASWWAGQEAPDAGAIRQRTLAICDFVLSENLMHAGSLSNSTADLTDFQIELAVERHHVCPSRPHTMRRSGGAARWCQRGERDQRLAARWCQSWCNGTVLT